MQEQPNFSYIKQLSGGDLVFEKKLIAIIIKELPEEIAQYKKNFKHESYQLAADDVHKLKHKISILGLEFSYQLATDYEEELRLDNTSNKNKFEEVLVAMTKFVDQLK